ncbi:hypothetical protein PUN28_011953 [Cardiocondyla obscurior]|uniref:Uncharacterized protein n=1 Tax=Cardiocondyla obscurior TaxID=286306 RepID=A0AAW2FBI7_9HYME
MCKIQQSHIQKYICSCQIFPVSNYGVEESVRCARTTRKKNTFKDYYFFKRVYKKRFHIFDSLFANEIIISTAETAAVLAIVCFKISVVNISQKS